MSDVIEKARRVLEGAETHRAPTINEASELAAFVLKLDDLTRAQVYLCRQVSPDANQDYALGWGNCASHLRQAAGWSATAHDYIPDYVRVTVRMALAIAEHESGGSEDVKRAIDFLRRRLGLSGGG